MPEPNNSNASDTPNAAKQPATRLTLLAQAKNQNNDAWDCLVNLYSPLVTYWCRRSGIRPDETEDIKQEVFIAAARGLATFRHDRPGDTFRGWLRGITRNVLLANYRRQKREPIGRGGTAAWEVIQSLAEPEVNLSDDDPAEQTQGLYHRALEIVRNQFEDRTWQMFWLSTVDERPVVEVAAQFAVSTAAVRKARSRVLHRLKQEVGDVLEESR
jgi:RNA polymerase sigma-70 factor, ECF subfamily